MKGHIEKQAVTSRVCQTGDHGMVDYAISRTYRILDSRRNKEKADCKICGREVPKGHGFHVMVATVSWPKDAYLCFTCFKPVKKAAEFFPLTIDGSLPPWWNELELPAGSPATKELAEELAEERHQAARTEIEQREQRSRRAK